MQITPKKTCKISRILLIAIDANNFVLDVENLHYRLIDVESS